MHDDDIASALNDGDSSELESLTSEDDGWTDCEDDEEEEIIEERSINNNAVELVSDDEEVQPQHNPSREVPTITTIHFQLGKIIICILLTQRN